jgi:DNA-binding transcriptional LysR family regulator
MQSAAAARTDFTGLLRLGVMETVVHTCLPTLLSRFSRLYPRVTVELHSDITPFLCDELLKGKLDCVLTTEEIVDSHVENRKLAELPMAWVAAPSLALPTERIDFARIAQLPLISFHRQSVIYRNILQLAGRPIDNGRELRVNCFSSLAAIISLTKTGFGVATLPLATIPQELAKGELRVLDVWPALLPLPVVASVQSNSSPAAEAFALLALEVFGEFVAEQKQAA